MSRAEIVFKQFVVAACSARPWRAPVTRMTRASRRVVGEAAIMREPRLAVVERRLEIAALDEEPR